MQRTVQSDVGRLARTESGVQKGLRYIETGKLARRSPLRPPPSVGDTTQADSRVWWLETLGKARSQVTEMHYTTRMTYAFSASSEFAIFPFPFPLSPF